MKTPTAKARLSLATVLLLGSLGLACGGGRKVAGFVDEYGNVVLNNLVFTLQDGTPVAMGTDYAICCGVWEPGYDERYVLKMFYYDHQILQGEPSGPVKAMWKLFIILDEVEIGASYTLPDQHAMAMYVFAPGDAEQVIAEASSDEHDSSGTITINSLSCGPPCQISLTADMTLGSELHDLPPVRVTGTFTGTIFTNPSPLGCDFAM